MSEKTYMLSAGDLDEYARLAILCHESQDAGMFDAACSVLGKMEALMQACEYRERTCTWKQDLDGNWHTECGEAHVFTEGTPHENKYAFCPYCGAKAVE